MASEDSDYVIAGYLAIHRLGDLKQTCQPVACEVLAAVDDLETSRKFLEVELFRSPKRIASEERHDRRSNVLSTVHRVRIHVLSMVVLASIGVDRPNAKERPESLQRFDALRTLCHAEIVRHLVASPITLSAFPIRLPD